MNSFYNIINFIICYLLITCFRFSMENKKQIAIFIFPLVFLIYHFESARIYPTILFFIKHFSKRPIPLIINFALTLSLTFWLINNLLRNSICSIPNGKYKYYFSIAFVYMYLPFAFISNIFYWITMIFISFLLLFSFKFIVDKDRQLKLKTKLYHDASEYLKISQELNLEYKKRLHENTNQLLFIRSMIASDNKKLVDYVDSLLENNKLVLSKSYILELNHLKLFGFKYFLNYKLIELLKINTKIELFVSDDLELIDDNCIKQLDYNDITTIIGVITDNMIDAVKEQDNKLVSICFYIEDGLIHMQFANSIKESVDLSEIFKSGFSTKGPNRGVGLS